MHDVLYRQGHERIAKRITEVPVKTLGTEAYPTIYDHGGRVFRSESGPSVKRPTTMSSIPSSPDSTVGQESVMESFISGIVTLSDMIEHTILEQYPYLSDGDNLFVGLFDARDVLREAVDTASGSAESSVLFNATQVTDLMKPIFGSSSHQDVQGEGTSSLYGSAIGEVEKLGPPEILRGFQDLKTSFELLENMDEDIEIAKISKVFAETEQRRREKNKMEAQLKEENGESDDGFDHDSARSSDNEDIAESIEG
jgi:hypothetical protein